MLSEAERQIVSADFANVADSDSNSTVPPERFAELLSLQLGRPATVEEIATLKRGVGDTELHLSKWLAWLQPRVCQTSYGALQGTVDAGTGVQVYKGIPFAQALRYALPCPPDKWEGVRSALDFGPGCPSQTWAVHKMMLGRISGKQIFEDADLSQWIPEALHQLDSPPGFESEVEGLTLNVWTPAIPNEADECKRPVLVYLCGVNTSPTVVVVRQSSTQTAKHTDCQPHRLHSGNWHMIVNGAALSQRGDCVNVSINSRNFGLGYLYKKGGDFPANLGLLDVVAALEWVKSEIRNFGGDPDNVTLWGESEGAVKSMLLLGSPTVVAKGLFHRVQATSGGTIPFQISEDEADARAKLLSKELAIPFEELCVERLRAIPLPQLTEAFTAVGKHNRLSGPIYPMLPFLPVACGELYPTGSAQKAMLAGCGRDIPFFGGVHRFEQLGSESDTAEAITDKLKERVQNPGLCEYEPPMEGWNPEDVIPAYEGQQHVKGSDDMTTAASCYKSELSFGLGQLHFQDAHGVDSNPRTFVFRIDYGSDCVKATTESPAHHIEQTRHFCDVGFWFRKVEIFPISFGLWDRHEYAKEESLKLQDIMSDMLIAFARTGNPSVQGFEYPVYGGEGVASTVVIGTADCYATLSVEEEGHAGSRVSLIRKAWGGLWKVPLF